MIQQGDVILVPAVLPTGAKEIAVRPLATGEGHYEHVLLAERAEEPAPIRMYEDSEGRLWAEVISPSRLTHRHVGGGAGEHGTIAVTPGTYRVAKVQEWDPWVNEARELRD